MIVLGKSSRDTLYIEWPLVTGNKIVITIGQFRSVFYIRLKPPQFKISVACI